MKMKKFLMTLAVVAMTAGAAMAQNKDDNKDCTNDCAQTEQCQKQDCNQPACCKKGGPKQACEFEGLNLTDAQKEQIKTIKEEQRAAAQAKKEAAKAQKAEKKNARQEGRKAYLEKIKAVLSPEQYVQYLENLVTRGHDGHKAMGRADQQKRFDKNAPRKVGDRAPKAVKAAKVMPAQKAE